MSNTLKVVYTSDVYGRQGLRYMHEGDAGLDLRCTEHVVLHAHSTKFVDCGLRIELPPHTFGAIRSRSGLAARQGVSVVEGTVDENFTGEIGCTMINNSGTDAVFAPGDRVAQIVVIPYMTAEVTPVDKLDDNAERGDAGYGSTGLK